MTKILKIKFEEILEQENYMKLLEEGNFHEFEELLYGQILNLYNKTVEYFVTKVSKSDSFKKKQKELGKKEGLKKLVIRQATIQIKTGVQIKYESYYAKKCPKNHEKERHLSLLYWSCNEGASPSYSSVVTLLSVICPSFMIAGNVLKQFQIKANYDRVRQIALATSKACISDRVNVQLEEEDSLKGKRVIVEMDGGRTRMRKYLSEEEKKTLDIEDSTKRKFSTPWQEPKVFIITAIDDNGKIIKKNLPIYDMLFGDDEVFELLELYLARLEIKEAESVQFIADGAPWIWNRVTPMLLKLGVEERKIIETLDYYHASEHIHEIKKYMDEEKQKSYFEQLKEALWQGNIIEMARIIKSSVSGVDLEKFTLFQYFAKNQYRINYQQNKSDKRPIGSGLIESAIRRIINLRFKAPSSFWYPDNVEKLIFMRGVALSGRWNIMMKNLHAKQKL
jgi:hypothetical protein